VKLVSLDVHGGQLLVGYFDAGRIARRVQRSLDVEACLRLGVGDEIDDGFMAGQRAASPVQGYLAKHPMFYLVPLAGPGRVV